MVVAPMLDGPVPDRRSSTVWLIDFVCQISFSLTSSILSPRGISTSRLLTPARAISGEMTILLSMHSVITINLESFADYGGIHICGQRTKQPVLLDYQHHCGKAVLILSDNVSMTDACVIVCHAKRLRSFGSRHCVNIKSKTNLAFTARRGK